MRILFEFSKGARLRFVSLLDMQRLMQRALRRSGLPIRYSEGYSPHAAMSFASALGIGLSSVAEILEVKMESECPLKEAMERMNASLPDDMIVNRVAAVDDAHPAAMALVRWADYSIELPRPLMPAGQSLMELLTEERIIAMRKTKSGEKETDIRPLIGGITADPAAPQRYNARLKLCEAGTLKPELLLQVACARAGLAYDTGDAVIVRTGLLTGDEASAALPVITYGVKEICPA